MLLNFVWVRQCAGTHPSLGDADWEEECTVEVEFVGGYRRATYEEPEEYPELEVLSVFSGDDDVIDFLSSKELAEIEDKAWQLYDERDRAGEGDY